MMITKEAEKKVIFKLHKTSLLFRDRDFLKSSTSHFSKENQLKSDDLV